MDLEKKRLKKFLKQIKCRKVGTKYRRGQCKIPTSKKRKRIKLGKKRLFPHQVAFFVKNGYLPPLVSHACHVHKCIEHKHLLDETDAQNKARERCSKLLGELKRKWKKKKKTKRTAKLFTDSCDHEPQCFVNVGRI
jgi:hypothetical protein